MVPRSLTASRPRIGCNRGCSGAPCAVEESNLRELPGDVLDELTAGASTVAVPAGSVMHWEGSTPGFCWRSSRGGPGLRHRTRWPDHDDPLLPTRRAHRGRVAVRERICDAGADQALVDAGLLRMSPTAARRAAERDPRVAGPARRGERTGPEFRLGDLRQCVRHGPPARGPASARPGVRALARTSFGAPVGIELVVKVSQRELAEAVGTAREVVVRVLRELRQDGVVEQDGTRS